VELLVGAGIVSMLALAPSRVSAQSLTGVVLLPDSATPASGVIVVATDAQGATTRALTGNRGQFTVRLPAVGNYRISLLRIGFRPTQLPAVNVGATAGPPVRFVLANQPVALSAVNVRDKETCRVSADTGFMVARVWEEARKAMLTTQLVAEGAPLVAEWIEYDRGMDSTARVVRQQHIRTSKSPTTHAFKSRPAAELDTTGYIVSDTTGTIYYAPDADVLLSDSFAAAHCFHLVEPPRSAGTSNLIGVAFQPLRDRIVLHDIDGTLWLDRTSAELRTLEFRYTGLPDYVAPANPGGRVEFLRLSDGGWLVSRWSLRMPVIGPRGTVIPKTGIGRVMIVTSTRDAAVRGVQMTGGEVTRVTRHDSLVYASTGPSVVVKLVSKDPAMKTSASWMTLDGTDYSASGNADGVLRVSPVLDGRYRARVSVPLMDSLGMTPVEQEVEARVQARADTVKLPTSRDVVVAACPRDSVKHGEGMVYGRVRDEHSSFLREAAVTATWPSTDARSVGDAAYGERTLGALTNDEGYWRICGVPHNLPLAIHLVSDSGVDAREVRIDDPQAFGTIDLVAHRVVAATDAAGSAAVASGRALVEIAVNQFAGPPLSDVTVEITANGRTRRVVTGETGRALIPDVAPGVLKVRARRIGFKQGELAVRVEAGRNTIPILLSTVDMPTLDTVRVVGNNRLVGIRRNDEFEMRRQLHQATVSFTEEDIKKRNVVDAWQMLTNVPSARVVDSGKVTIESTRSTNMTPDFQVRKCYMQVMVDGILIPPLPGDMGLDLRTLPKPNEIHGMEVFAGPASIPVQYGGTGTDKWCGLVAIWTK
jgi:hypothetical protein